MFNIKFHTFSYFKVAYNTLAIPQVYWLILSWSGPEQEQATYTKKEQEQATYTKKEQKEATYTKKQATYTKKEPEQSTSLFAVCIPTLASTAGLGKACRLPPVDGFKPNIQKR
uniref:Uncharacterized protein n=1 Tax=Glossina palpalis gambiensis TaxID=67801 RepID=A0A1B0BJ73_9MUSC